MTVYEILSLVSVFLSASTALFVGFVEFRRYYLPLRMAVHSWEVLQYGENYSVAVFHFSFVNPSTRGKTVFHLTGHMPPNIIVSQVRGQSVLDGPYLEYILPKQGGRDSKYRVHDAQILLIPLDILPHQSRSGDVCYHIFWGEGADIQKFDLPLCSFDVYNHEMAKCVVSLTITGLKTLGVHMDSSPFPQIAYYDDLK